jgi:hypothetical protein
MLHVAAVDIRPIPRGLPFQLAAVINPWPRRHRGSGRIKTGGKQHLPGNRIVQIPAKRPRGCLDHAGGFQSGSRVQRSLSTEASFRDEMAAGEMLCASSGGGIRRIGAILRGTPRMMATKRIDVWTTVFCPFEPRTVFHQPPASIFSRSGPGTVRSGGAHGKFPSVSGQKDQPAGHPVYPASRT